MRRVVTTYHLEMTDPGQLRPSSREHVLDLVRAEVPCPELSRFLYTAVGGHWYWCGRLSWTYDRWLAYLDRPELETWVGYLQGTPVGYCELERQPGGSVEIAYFGLLPQFVGQGLGGELLTRAMQRAWAMDGVQRVWVHTCTLDGPHALANYQARGFQVFLQESEEEELPDAPIGPWPGYAGS